MTKKCFFYLTALAVGVIYFITIYVFEFDQHSEEDLIKLSYRWAAPGLFGLAGVLAESLGKSSRSVVFAAVTTLIGMVAMTLLFLAFF
jgi:hypothetical protein